MKSVRITQTLLALLMAVGTGACGYYHEAKDQGNTGAFRGDETLGFEVVKTIFSRNRCLQCHVAGGISGINLTTYAGAKPNAQSIVDAVADGSMPKGGPAVNARDQEVLQAWVAAGAPESSAIPIPGGPPEEVPDGPIDPPGLNFTGMKAAIFVPHCSGCHSGFTDYTRVASMLKEIQHAVDTNLMPENGPPLSPELKTMLAEWIALGAPER